MQNYSNQAATFSISAGVLKLEGRHGDSCHGALRGRRQEGLMDRSFCASSLGTLFIPLEQKAPSPRSVSAPSLVRTLQWAAAKRPARPACISTPFTPLLRPLTGALFGNDGRWNRVNSSRGTGSPSANDHGLPLRLVQGEGRDQGWPEPFYRIHLNPNRQPRES